MVETIQWTNEGVVMIDQTRLPREEVYVTCRSYTEVADAIHLQSNLFLGVFAVGGDKIPHAW
jgi:methylthioribose-1-phosphate isomerase